MISDKLLAKLIGSKDLNVRYTAVNCPVCWAAPGERCFRMSGGKVIKSRRVMPHSARRARFRRRIGF